MPVWYLPTNRHNVLAMWSGGLLCGPAGLEKYRSDLLEEAPGRLVLVNGPIGGALVGRISDPEAHSYPAMLELEIDEVGQPVAQLGDLRVAAPSGVLPAYSVRAVHIRDEREQREIAARSFSNVAAAALPLVVTPSLFEGPDTASQLLELTGALNNLTAGELTTEKHRGLDMACGGVLNAGTACPADEALLRCVAAGFGHVRTGDGDVLTGHRELLLEVGVAGENSDLRLLSAVMSALSERGPDEPPVGTEFLAGLHERLASGSDEDLDRGLDRIGQILRGRREFERFADPVSAPALKALLLFLARPDPEDVLTWSSETTGAHPAVLVVAAWLAGTAAGYRRIPLKLRGTDALQRLLVAWTVDRLNGSIGSPFPRETEGEIRTLVDEQAGGCRVAVAVGDDILLERVVPVPEKVRAADDPPVIEGALAVQVARALGWDDCVRFRVVASDAALASAGRRIVVTFPADAVVTQEVDPSRFAELIAGVDADALRSAVAAADSPAPAPKPRRRKPGTRGSSNPRLVPPEDGGEMGNAEVPVPGEGVESAT